MFNKILVAIDQSELAEHVVEIAIAQAKTTGGSLLLLHVINVHEKEFPQLEGHISGNYNPEAFDAEAKSYEQYWKRYEQMGLHALSPQQAGDPSGCRRRIHPTNWRPCGQLR